MPGKLHRWNALVLVAFLSAHLLTHLSGALGIEAYNLVQDAFGAVYRHRFLEPLLLASITIQLVLGTVLLLRALRAWRNAGVWRRIQLLSGGLFLIFMAQHLFSLGMARWYFGLETNFYWPASVMSGPPFVYYFAAYYFIGVLAIVTHLAVAARLMFVRRGQSQLGSRVAITLIAIGTIVSAAILPVLSGMLFSIDLPQEWVDYLRFYDADFSPR